MGVTEISVREAAQWLGVGLSHVYRLLWAGKIPARKEDGKWRVSAQAIEQRLQMRHQADGLQIGDLETIVGASES